MSRVNQLLERDNLIESLKKQNDKLREISEDEQRCSKLLKASTDKKLEVLSESVARNGFQSENYTSNFNF